MTKDKLYQKYLKKWQEVVEIPPQTVGFFTPIYKKTIPFFKIAPWRVLIPISFVIAVLMALVLETSILKIVSLLQKGF